MTIQEFQAKEGQSAEKIRRILYSLRFFTYDSAKCNRPVRLVQWYCNSIFLKFTTDTYVIIAIGSLNVQHILGKDFLYNMYENRMVVPSNDVLYQRVNEAHAELSWWYECL